MGAKTGYADVILRCLGLRPGQGADHYLWCEPDAGVRLLLHAYTDRELALAAADIIRGWKDEEPRALWERLRAEGPAVCPPVGAREVARWAWVQGHEDMHGRDVKPQYQPGAQDRDTWKPPPRDWLADRLDAAPNVPATIIPDARNIDPREVARAARIISANRLVNPDPVTWRNIGDGGYAHGGAEFCTPIERLADGMAAVPRVDAAAVVDDARGVDPREVARWVLGGVWSYRQGEIDSGFVGPGARRQDTTATATATATARVALGIAATITDDARTLDPPKLPPGTVAYIDPPYKDTTGYAHAFPRSEWLPLVRRWRDAGAVVCVSEAEPIPDLMAEGWHAVEITGERKGQKRTFSKQKTEWLTMSEPPRWRPSVQGSLFG